MSKFSEPEPEKKHNQDIRINNAVMILLNKIFWTIVRVQEDEEEGGEDDDDDGFFVPHGYLSDDEGALEEEVWYWFF